MQSDVKFKKTFRRWWKILKKAGLLSVGAILAQAISFVSLPVLARIYGPVEFGRYSILIAVALMFTPLATLKLETLMVVEKNDQKAALYLHLALLITLSISILILISSLLVVLISEATSAIKFEYLWLFVPFIIIVNSIILLSQQIALRHQSYKTFSLTGISQSIFVALSQIGLSIVAPKAINLIFGWFLGKIVGVSWVLPKTREFWKFHTGEMSIYFKTLRKIYPQIKLLNQGSLFEAIAVAFPTIYVGIVFGNELAGIFSMSQVLLMAPIVLVGSGIGSLILSEYSSDSGVGTQIAEFQKRGIRKVFLVLIIILLLYLAFYYLFAEILIQNFLGPDWLPAVELFSLIILPYSVGLVWYPLVNLFWAKQDWRSYRRFSSIRMILPIALAIFSYTISLDWKLTICLVSWGTAISQILGIYMVNSKWKFLNF
jgi:O-antigen/teichoic acid export membrane protein